MAVGATGLWKTISFVNALLVAAYFGVTQETDIYFYLIMLVGIGIALIQSLNTSSIIPEAMVLRAQRAGSEQDVLNFFLFLYGFIALLFTLVGFLYPLKIIVWCSRFTLEQLVLNRPLVSLGFLLFGLQLLSLYLTAILEMYHRFSAALLSPLNAILPLSCLLVFGQKIGIISMMYGFVLSYFLQDILLWGALKKELHWQLRLPQNPLSHRLLHNLLSTGIQAVLNIINSLLPLYLLSGLGTGWVSALNYAKQLSETPTEILSARIANLSKIQLTEQVSHQNWKQGNENYLAVNHFLLFLLAPLTLFSCFYAPEIVTMFFAHGAFTAQDGQMAAGFLRPLLAIMLLTAPSLLQANVLSATRMWKEFLPYSLIGYFLFLVAVPFTMARWGGFAYAYTLLVTFVIGFLITYAFLRKQIPSWQGKTSLLQLGRICSLNIIALVPSAVYAFYFASSNPWITVFIGGVIFMTGLTSVSYYSGDLPFFIRQCFPKQD